MNLLLSVVVFCALPLILLIAARRSGLVALAMMAMAIMGVLSLHLLAHPTTGIVAGKTETLEFAQRGLAPRVTHHLALTVITRSGPTDAYRIGVDPLRYDAVHRGDAVALRELQWGPFRWATLDAMPFWNVAPDQWEELRSFVAARGPSTAGTAQIESVRTVRSAYVSSWVAAIMGDSMAAAQVSLAAPYEEVTLRLNAGAEVLALDRIDTGSAGMLMPGSTVAVLYPADRPRSAQLAGATRRFAALNRHAERVGEAIVFGLCVCVLLLAAFLRLKAGRASAAGTVR